MGVLTPKNLLATPLALHKFLAQLQLTLNNIKCMRKTFRVYNATCIHAHRSEGPGLSSQYSINIRLFKDRRGAPRPAS